MKKTFIAFVWLAASPAHAQPIEISPGEDLEAAINALEPGDELVVHGGTYDVTDAGRFSVDIAGTESDPISIRAADGETPIVQRTDDNENLIDFDRIEHASIRGIEFVGGSAGLRFSGGRFVTIEGCDIHDTADVAIRANDEGVLYEGFHIVGNEVHHTNGTGEAMYLGCNEDGCQFANALIERNYVHHTNGPGVEQGDGIEIKEGSYGNVVRDNVIHDTNYPCILTYSTVGNGEPNTIERNVMWNCGDHAIQIAADGILRNNIILGAGGDGIAMQPHQSGAPSNLIVVHNTIVHPDGTAISVHDATGSVTIANNALYAPNGDAIFVTGGGAIVALGNVGVGSAGDFTIAPGDLGNDFVGANLSGSVPNDVFPAPGSALIGAGDPDHTVVEDFNGTLREGAPDVGAYAFDEGGNPGWDLAAGFRDQAPVAPMQDGGMGPERDGGRASDRDGGMSGDEGGCGCRAAPRSVSPIALLALTALFGAISVRARRRRLGRAR